MCERSDPPTQSPFILRWFSAARVRVTGIVRSFFSARRFKVVNKKLIPWIALIFIIGSFASGISPPVGTYIATLALMSFVVTIWSPANTSGRLSWLAVFLLLTLLEIQHEARLRQEERESFKSIADGLTNSMAQNQRAFDATMKRMESLAQLSSEAIYEVTGGDSFCYVLMTPVPQGLGFIVSRKGRHPLFHITVTIADLDAFKTALETAPLDWRKVERSRRTFPVIEFLNRGSAWGPLIVDPVVPALEYRRFNVFIFARNGAFTPLIRLKRSKTGGWSIATIVSASYPNKKSGIVYERISRDFPVELLETDQDWINFRKLKILEIAE